MGDLKRTIWYMRAIANTADQVVGNAHVPPEKLRQLADAAELAMAVPRLRQALTACLERLEANRSRLVGSLGVKGAIYPQDELIAEIRNVLAMVVDADQVVG